MQDIRSLAISVKYAYFTSFCIYPCNECDIDVEKVDGKLKIACDSYTILYEFEVLYVPCLFFQILHFGKLVELWEKENFMTHIKILQNTVIGKSDWKNLRKNKVKYKYGIKHSYGTGQENFECAVYRFQCQWHSRCENIYRIMTTTCLTILSPMCMCCTQVQILTLYTMPSVGLILRFFSFFFYSLRKLSLVISLYFRDIKKNTLNKAKTDYCVLNNKNTFFIIHK